MGKIRAPFLIIFVTVMFPVVRVVDAYERVQPPVRLRDLWDAYGRIWRDDL